MFDYSIVKRAIRALCDEIDEKVLLPEQSPHLAIEHEGDYVIALFNGGGFIASRCLDAPDCQYDG